MWPRWIVLNRKLVLPAVGVALILILLIWLGVLLFSGSTLSEKDLFDQALTNTAGCSSYRYSVEVKQAGGNTISAVEGSRVKPGRIHIKGTMQKSSMEFIQIEDTTYMKDPWSEKWFTLKGNSVAQSDLFLTEFNPLGLFNFKDIPIIKKTGTEKVDGVKTDVLDLRPNVANPFMDQKYSAFKFRVWVNPRDKFIRRAQMQAFLPGGAAGLTVDMKFWGFNEKIEIAPPQEKSLEF